MKFGRVTDQPPGKLSFPQSLQLVFQRWGQHWKASSTRGFLLLATVGLGASLLIPALATGAIAQTTWKQPQLLAQKKPVEITLASFAVTKEAHDKIIPLFVEKWKREKNQDVVFQTSYGGSGSQTRAIIDGLEADVAHLALGLDTGRLAKAGLQDPNWERKFPNDSVVSKSVVALVTRPGNPKRIRKWEDLAQPGLNVVTANPKTSGVARWNFLGLWGAVSQTGGSEADALKFTTAVFRNAPVLARDARENSDIFFKKQQGDVLINYENEVILAAQKGERGIFSVVPAVNISIDNTISILDKNVDKHGNREVAEAFVRFLYSPEAQREFAKAGFRPVDSGVAKEFEKKFPKVSKLYTIKDFGGWDAVQSKFFADGAIFDQIQSSIR